MADYFESYIDNLRSIAAGSGEAAAAAKQLMMLHSAASNAKVVLELGVDRGQSTRVFLNALKGHGHLVSVDIRDCEIFKNRADWLFVQSDSTDVENIVSKAPQLSEGIDIIYVDSLHQVDHVRSEIYRWWPLLKRGGTMFFDDISSGPYLIGSRKDSYATEINNRKINELIQRIYFANTANSDLVYHYGSTGIGVLKKSGDASDNLNEDVGVPQRRRRWLWRVLKLLRIYRGYNRVEDGSDFLVPLD